MRFRSGLARKSTVFLVAAAMSFPSVGAADGIPQGVSNLQLQEQATVNAETGVGSVSNTGGGASQNQAAKMGQSQNNSSSGIAQAIGAALIAAGAALMSNPPTVPPGAMLMALGMLAMAQSGANAGTAGAHGAQSTLNQDYGTGAYGTGGGTTTVPSMKGAVAELKKYGVNYDASSGKFTFPNGKTVSAKDLTNQAAMAEAGVSAADFAKAMDTVKDAEKKAAAEMKLKEALAKQAMSFDNPASGGGGATAASFRNPADDGSSSGGARRDRPEVSVAGMSVNLGGDRIGVAGDDIFSMMARRYREKDNKDSFLPPNAAPDASFY